MSFSSPMKGPAPILAGFLIFQSYTGQTSVLPDKQLFAPDPQLPQNPAQFPSDGHDCDYNPDIRCFYSNVPYPKTAEKHCHTSAPKLPGTSGTAHCYNEVPASPPPDEFPAFHHKKPIYLTLPHMAAGYGTQVHTPVHVHTYKIPLTLSKIQVEAAADAMHKCH